MEIALVLSVLAFCAGYAAGRLRSYALQNDGEALVRSEIEAHFPPPHYHLMNHLTLPLADGTTQIDHILISRYGVFVIETKSYKGWIFASAHQKRWTQVIFRYKYQFQNPLMQNHGHLRAVRQLLDFLPPEAIKPAVVFVGSAEFKTDVPEGVFTLVQFLEYVRSHSTEQLSGLLPVSRTPC